MHVHAMMLTSFKQVHENPVSQHAAVTTIVYALKFLLI